MYYLKLFLHITCKSLLTPWTQSLSFWHMWLLHSTHGCRVLYKSVQGKFSFLMSPPLNYTASWIAPTGQKIFIISEVLRFVYACKIQIQNPISIVLWYSNLWKPNKIKSFMPCWVWHQITFGGLTWSTLMLILIILFIPHGMNI